jgi:hypothetical protein
MTYLHTLRNGLLIAVCLPIPIASAVACPTVENGAYIGSILRPENPFFDEGYEQFEDLIEQLQTMDMTPPQLTLDDSLLFDPDLYETLPDREPNEEVLEFDGSVHFPD